MTSNLAEELLAGLEACVGVVHDGELDQRSEDVQDAHEHPDVNGLKRFL